MTGVVDQHVDASADPERGGRQAFTIAGDGQVGDDGGDAVAELRCERVEPVGTARRDHHVRARAVQHTGEPVSEPG